MSAKDSTTGAGAQILVAEDNETNQELIRRQLARLGWRCDVAASGREALAMWRTGGYRLLLTDLRMPDIDGFGLVAAIRAEEAGSGKRVPIIAISANAYGDEAARCLSTGMDGYLSKPVDMAKLRALLHEHLGAAVDAATTAPAMAPDTAALEWPPPMPVDTASIRATYGDEDEVVREILESFVEHARRYVQAILDACAGGSADGVEREAHKLKSSARSVGAHALADLCERLERAGQAGDRPLIDEASQDLRRRLAAIEVYVERLRKDPV